MKLSQLIVFLFGISVFSSDLRAEDIVKLVNGNQISGIVLSESPSSVILEKNGIKLTLKRTEISSIERMDGETRMLAVIESKAPRPHEEDYYPAIARPMFYELGELDSLKSEWIKAREKTESLERQYADAKSEIVRLDRMIKIGKKQLKEFSLDENLSTLAKNKRIEDHNRLVKQTDHFIMQIRRDISNLTAYKNQIDSSYQSTIEKRRLYVSKAQGVGRNWMLLEKQMDKVGQTNSRGFAELNRRMKMHPVAFQGLKLKRDPPYVRTSEGNKIYTLPRSKDGHFYLTATLNQIQHVEFLIDTGATFSLLPESTGIAVGARRVGPAVKSKIADGRSVDTFPAIIDEIEIYGQLFKNVRVGLMADQGKRKITNLLGMNVISQIPLELKPEGLLLTIDPDL